MTAPAPPPPPPPVVSWTPSEAWLFAELARRALRCSVALEVEIQAGAEDVELVLRVAGSRATLTLDTTAGADAEVAGHRWRDAWVLELTRPAPAGAEPEVWTLARDTPALELAATDRASLTARLRTQRRALRRPLDDGEELVPIADAAFHRYTRQSTRAPAAPATLAPWMSPTTAEAAPWWELDLGHAMYVASLRLELGGVVAGARLTVTAFGFPAKDGGPPRGCYRRELALTPDVAGDVAVRLGDAVVARYVRVTLTAPDGAAVALAVRACEVLAAELFAATLRATLRRAFALHHDRSLFFDRADADAPYAPVVGYGELWRQAAALGRALAQRLAAPPAGARHIGAIVLRNRPAWLVAELAALDRGHVSVPLAPDDADDRLGQILARARPTWLVCTRGDADRLAALAPTAQLLVVCDASVADAAAWATATPRRARLEDLLAAAPATVPPPALAGEDELYTVLFTSGSTGAPRGAMRSYATFQAMLASYPVDTPARHLSFQPLSHLSERMFLPALLLHGAAIACARGGPHLMAELAAFAPTVVGSVPRLFEVLYARYRRRLAALTAAAPDVPAAAHEATALAEARAAFGGNLRALGVGSAPVGAEVLGFLRRCFADLWVTEGYGSTEVGTIAVDGRVAAHVEVKLVPAADAVPPAAALERGEIWVRTPHAILGYLDDVAATRAALDADGYFATGDLGERGADGIVRVVGRLRSAVKLAHGEFVTAERVEAALAAAPLVDRIYVHAQAGAPALAALIVPAAEPLARLVGAAPTTPLATLCADPRAPALVREAVRLHGQHAGLAAWELPHQILLEPTALTHADGLLTASGKLARAAIAARFGPRLAALATDDRPAAPLDSLAVAELLTALDLPASAWGQAPGSQVPVDVPAFRGHRVSVRRVLLTGATGFLGSHLLEALLAHTDLDVVCLVRADDAAAAAARLDTARARYRIPPGPATRVRAIAGDLAAPRLGLDAPRWTALADDVDAILHAGARVSWLAPLAGLAAANVDGTRALVELAAAGGRLRPLHFVSTISTAPADGDETSFLPYAAAATATPYALSKWLAEDHVRRAAAAGLPAAIYRPALIAGHSRRGVGNPDDFLHRYVDGVRQLGRYLALDDARLDMTPVDFVADAIVALLLAAPDGGATYHLANVEQSMTYAALGGALGRAGIAATPATYGEFRAALVADGTTRLAALAPFFPATGFALASGPWPCTRTVARLRALGVERPVVDDALIARYVATP